MCFKILLLKWYNVVKLDIYRIRKGNIRIIVTLEDDEIVIEAIITDIGFRGNIYKR